MKYLRELALLRCGESYDNQGRLSKGFQELLLDFFAKKICSSGGQKTVLAAIEQIFECRALSSVTTKKRYFELD